MTDEARPPGVGSTGNPVDRPSRDRVLEIIAGIALGVAAVAAAWSGYQASLWVRMGG